MADPQDTNHRSPKLILPDAVQIYSNGDNEVRFRRGIWNHEEAILDLEGLSPEHRETLTQLIARLEDGQAVDPAALPNEDALTQAEKEQVVEMLQSLQDQLYICADDWSVADHLFFQLLGGGPKKWEAVAGDVTNLTDLPPILFFADNESVKDYAVSLADTVQMPLTVMSDEDFKAIRALDVTTRYEAYDTRKHFQEVLERVEPYSTIVGCIERPQIAFLRNLNRALVHTSQPLSLAILDGPFTSIMTLKPPETGCFECFEHRLMARMLDMAVYQRFADSTRKFAESGPRTQLSPLLHSLTSQVLFEAFLISKLGKAKLAGRVLNTYVPVMEIQMQTLLRVPFCPACGFSAQAKMEEMYTSTQKIVERLHERITVTAD